MIRIMLSLLLSLALYHYYFYHFLNNYWSCYLFHNYFVSYCFIIIIINSFKIINVSKCINSDLFYFISYGDRDWDVVDIYNFLVLYYSIITNNSIVAIDVVIIIRSIQLCCYTIRNYEINHTIGIFIKWYTLLLNYYYF